MLFNMLLHAIEGMLAILREFYSTITAYLTNVCQSYDEKEDTNENVTPSWNKEAGICASG